MLEKKTNKLTKQGESQGDTSELEKKIEALTKQAEKLSQHAKES